jgi:hypothetical protein
VSIVSPADLLAVAFAALDGDQQDEAFQKVNTIRLRRLAGEDSDTARMIRSLLRVAEEVGGQLTVDDYRQIRVALAATGEEVEEVTRAIRHFGTWRMATEALELSEVTTPRRIQARFDSRRVGKVWKYTEATLRDTLQRCVEH